jgi:hypothetical protein
MKIKFNLGQLLILIATILTIYYLGPLFYNAWVNPEYDKYGNMTHDTIFIRMIGSIIIVLPIIIYLIVTDGAILTKKREINLIPWKSTN